MILVDIVNFNADGSCLEAGAWLRALEGGRNSRLCAWLRSYVELGRKVSLGWIGATIADVAARNPEAIELLRAHREIFEILLRPFAHDVALLRSARGFRTNLQLGKAALERELGDPTPFFLPPEFMMTAEGILELAVSGVEGVFINAARFGPELRDRIPTAPYRVLGVMGASLPCVPLAGRFTREWLESMHRFEPEPWNSALRGAGSAVVATWRDGETFLFLPEGEARERRWLAGEANEIERRHVREVFAPEAFSSVGPPDPGCLRSYPPHSFTEWFRESRMMGFLRRVEAAEARLSEFGTEELALWLQAINSDVLSAVEKESPVIELASGARGGAGSAFRLLRSERGFEGEDCLSMLERWNTDGAARDRFAHGEAAYLVKLRARAALLSRLGGARR